MSNTARIAATAANTLTKPLNIEEVFSTYLLDGSGTITNGIDLAGEGGLLWTKWRSGGALSFYQNHFLYDTERGYGSTDYLHSNNTDAAGATGAIGSGSFNSDGFTTGGNVFSGNEWASWTFRKAPKFFDVVTYTGTGSGATVNHNLGVTPSCIIIKSLNTSGADDWYTYHVSVGTSGYLMLNQTSGTTSRSNWISVSDTSFTVDALAGQGSTNYVAYLFAHNDGDGTFGPDGDADIIKCGSYTGNGSTTGPEIDLGFEPQWLLVKGATVGSDWQLLDSMRGITTGGNDQRLEPSSSSQEYSVGYVDLTATGFYPTANNSNINFNNETYIYIAIRRGPMAVPESATDVFDVELANATTTNGVEFQTGWPVDFAWFKDRDTGTEPFTLLSRLQGNGNYMFSSSTAAESSGVSYGTFDHSDGWYSSTLPSDYYSCMWRRAPNFFDVVAYTGGSGADTISHNLGVTPEMIWVKNRDDAGMAARQKWVVYHASVSSGYLNLHDTVALQTSDAASKFGNGSSLVAPTADNFTVADDYDIGRSGYNYIAYLFASLDGVSKVGSYTGTGNTAQTIDCGFSSGARFVLIKRSSGASQWHVFDTERGITSTVNDGVLYLNLTNAEQPESSAFGASIDAIQPDSSGFKVQYSDLNASGETFIFYAIA